MVRLLLVTLWAGLWCSVHGANLRPMGVAAHSSGERPAGQIVPLTPRNNAPTGGAPRGLQIAAPQQRPCAQPTLTDAHFEQLWLTVKALSFEASRLTQAQQIVQSHCLTAHQLKRLLELFTFEQTRLDLARFAYPRLPDPENFPVVYAAFQFEQSVRQLQQMQQPAR